MRRFASFFVTLTALLATAAPCRTAGSPDASTLPPMARPFGVEIAMSFGSATATDSGSYDPYGFGLRGRAGVVVHDVYAGVVVGAYGLGSGPASMLAGVQLGYGFRFASDLLVLRPTIGAGVFAPIGAGSENGVFQGPPWADNQRAPIFVEPGVTFLYTPGLLLLGANANVLLPAVDQVGEPGGFPVGVSFAADIGVRVP